MHWNPRPLLRRMPRQRDLLSMEREAGEPLARISHQKSTAGADLTSLRGLSFSAEVGVSGHAVPRASGAKPAYQRKLRTLATMSGEKCGLEGFNERA
jgi:hypothetical protein